MTERSAEIEPVADSCICDPEGPCDGVPGESDACDACLTLNPEEPCLHDPDVCEDGVFGDPLIHHLLSTPPGSPNDGGA